MMPSNQLILSVLFTFCLQSFPASRSFPVSQRFTSWCWPKYWSFSFSISPFNEYSGLISFRIDWISLQSKGLSRVFSSTMAMILQHSAWLFPMDSLPVYQVRRYACAYFFLPPSQVPSIHLLSSLYCSLPVTQAVCVMALIDLFPCFIPHYTKLPHPDDFFQSILLRYSSHIMPFFPFKLYNAVGF